MWLDLELSGWRPEPLVRAAIASIDRHRAFLYGVTLKKESHSRVINLYNEIPSPRHGHALCQLAKQGLEAKSICLLVGGCFDRKTNSDNVYVLDCENSMTYQMDVDQDLGNVWLHTCHCVQNEDGTTDVIICGGIPWDETSPLQPVVRLLRLNVKNESYMSIEREILFSRGHPVRASTSSPRLSPSSETEEIGVMNSESEHPRQMPSSFRTSISALRLSISGSEEIEMLQRELEHFRQRCAEMEEEKKASVICFDTEKASIREELASCQRLKDEEIASLSEELSSAAQRHSNELASLTQRQREEIASVRDELAVSLTRCQNLVASRNEIKQRLDEFTDVLNINPAEVKVTAQKVGSGAFASVSVGEWRGMKVAVKQIHDLITSQRNIELFEQEFLVCSRLHHPNIMTVCGAVMAEGVPLQLVMELLEGSVSEVLDEAQASESNLNVCEQLSIAMDMTSGISYLHQIRPRPYVHGDIRPSNILVTKDMKGKVGDLGTAHLIESSLSAGPVSEQYLAPERKRPPEGTATLSTLPSDVYSVGVSLIEIFTGKKPASQLRRTQLDALANRPNLFKLCSSLIDCYPVNRPSAQECFDALKTEFRSSQSHLLALGLFPTTRLVKGVFGKDGHRVQLSGSFY
ncbi:uncharacterized protein [Oscarella lobularis]|uniref:uncharacterized protein isoform X2 n=1 Tax=Oscarella lobularis TaxID=121494 RepID=UPI003313BFAB